MIRILVIFGKCISHISSFFHLGAGGTWPGEILLKVYPHILTHLVSQLRRGVVLIAGTNGKTTTSAMISHILLTNKKRVVLNTSGANLLNGIVSSLIQYASWDGKIEADFGVFEVDENSLPLVLTYVKPKIIVLTNLFRDQLDRYGEVDTIAEKWRRSLVTLPRESTIILNSDDPHVAYLGKDTKSKVIYFGIEDTKYAGKKKEHATDSLFCIRCGKRLLYHHMYYSHLGDWYCSGCGETRSKPVLSSWTSPLPGVYNVYNTLASVLVSKELGVSEKDIKRALSSFSPAFGRQEEFVYDGKKVKIFLSKNPVGFNESLKTILSLRAQHILLVLNDRIPDGLDVSWIWDVDFEMIPDHIFITVSGDRVYDLAIRVKYALPTKNKDGKLKIYEDLHTAIEQSLNAMNKDEILYILPTYSAMLEVRKIITGRKIL